jgi:hypothetical protein
MISEKHGSSVFKYNKRSPALRGGSHLPMLVFRAQKEAAFEAKERGVLGHGFSRRSASERS